MHFEYLTNHSHFFNYTDYTVPHFVYCYVFPWAEKSNVLVQLVSLLEWLFNLLTETALTYLHHAPLSYCNGKLWFISSRMLNLCLLSCMWHYSSCVQCSTDLVSIAHYLCLTSGLHGHWHNCFWGAKLDLSDNLNMCVFSCILDEFDLAEGKTCSS